MARVEISETVLLPVAHNVRAVPGASVQVNLRGSSAATVYQAETGVTTVSNPLTTDAQGRIEGWLEEGSYDLVVSGTGITTYTQKFEAYSGASGVAMEVWRNTAQSIPNDTLTDLTFEEGAANGALGASYWTVASPTLITFQREGMYSVALAVNFATNATGYRYLNIRKVGYDGSTSTGSMSQAAVTGVSTRMQLYAQLKVTTIGQQIKAQVRQTSGGALNVDSTFDGEGFSPVLMIARVGPAYDRVF